MEVKEMITVDIERTGKNIDQMRRDSGLNVSDVLERMGLASPNSFSKWIHGKSLPTIDNLVILADLFGVGIGEIVATKAV